MIHRVDWMYAAIDVARFILRKCELMGRPVDNLKLQKLLYFVWTDYYKETGKSLFDDRIEAWAYGPVVPSVYYHYRRYVSSKIPAIERYCKFNPIDEKIISKSVQKYALYSVGRLIDMTHQPNTPWSISKEKGWNAEIPKRLIMRYCDGE